MRYSTFGNLRSRRARAILHIASGRVFVVLGLLAWLTPSLATAQATFHATTSWPVGIGPTAVVTADFNGDGKPDLATANQGGGASILIGNGQGAFSTAFNLGAGTGPRAAATADFNGDGNQDLAIVNQSSQNVSILAGDGLGAFAAPVHFAVGFDPYAVAVGDFNADGLADLAVANATGNNVSILKNNGSGGFVAAVNFGVGSFPLSVAVGDFNGDGKQDLAVANSAGSTVSILAGNGLGGFSAPVNFAVGSGPSTVAVGDFNADGKQDLAIAKSNSNTAVILMGNGAGSFGAPLTLGLGGAETPYSLAVTDTNGDAKQDLVLACANNNVSILSGDGFGGFAVPVNITVGGGPGSIAVGDFNLDGQPDLAVAATFRDHITLLTSDGSGGFVAAPRVMVGASPSSVTLADFDGDGNQDIAAMNQSSNSVSILAGNGLGGFAAAVNFSAGTNPTSLAVGDFNGDTRPDLAVTNYSSNNVSILAGNGSGGFAAAVNLLAGWAPVSVAVGDFNGDGMQDLAVANFNSNNVSILVGNGLGGFAGAVQFAAGLAPRSAAIGDFNGDGKQDLVVANSGAHVSLLAGDGSGGFAAPVTFNVGGAPESVAVGDFNGDGKQDLAVANYITHDVSILLGNGFGSFAPAAPFAVGFDPVFVGISDLNNDGKQDLAVANSGSEHVSVLLGDGLGGFGPAANFGTGSAPYSIAIGDFNADGRQDMAVANISENTVSLLLNTTPILAVPCTAGSWSANGLSTPAACAPASPGYFVASAGATSQSPCSPGAFQPLAGQTSCNSAQAGFFVAAPASISETPCPAGEFQSFSAQTSCNPAPAGSFVSVTAAIAPTPCSAGSYQPLTGQTSCTLASPGFFVPSAGAISQTPCPSGYTSGAGASACSAVGFELPTDVATGLTPFSVASSDFNGDTFKDLAVANKGGNSLSILLGDGTGVFTLSGTFSVGAEPYWVTVDDFNLDGKADLAVANSISSSVSVLLGDGSAGFSNAGTYATSGNVVAVTSADFNGDGKPDLAYSRISANLVSVRLGDGSGGFGSSLDLPVGSQPFGLAVGDFNGDSNRDIAAANLSGGGVSILLGNGSGGFAGAVGYAAGATPSSVAVADLNGDAIQDLAVPNTEAAGQVSILIGNGSGGFAPPVGYAVGSQPYGAVANQDLDADGKKDIVVANYNGNSISLLRGDGLGGFAPALEYGVGSFPISLAVDHLNSDGKLDIAVANSVSHTVSILLNNFSAPQCAAGTWSPNGLISPAACTPASSGHYVPTAGATAETPCAAGTFQALTGQTSCDLAPAGHFVDTAAAAAATPCSAGSYQALTGQTSCTQASPGFFVSVSGATNQVACAPGFTSNAGALACFPVGTTLSVNAVSVSEGNSGIKAANLSITRSGGATAVTFLWTIAGGGVADGSATLADSDYVASGGSFTFPAGGANTRTFVMPGVIVGDTKHEPNETLTVAISRPDAGPVGSASNTLTITNDDAVPTISVSAASSVTEGGSAVFTATLSRTSYQQITVDIAAAPIGASPASSPGDFASTPTTLIFPPGATTATSTFLVTTVPDLIDENNETFAATLSNPQTVFPGGAALGISTRTVSITDNDAAPVLTISDTLITEGDPATTVSATFTVTLTGLTEKPVAVNYATENVTATVAGGDYVALPSTSLSFMPGGPAVQSLVVTATVNGDALAETNETFRVRLTGPANASIADNLGVATIIDDDAKPQVSISGPASVLEGNGPGASAVFSVTLNATSGQNVSVRATISNGTTTSADYTNPGSLTIAIPAGTMSATYTVPIVGDLLDEAPSETFTVTLSNPVGATIAGAGGAALTAILDDDDPPSLSIGNVTTLEGDSGAQVYTFGVNLSAASGRTVTVAAQTANGTATAPSDFIANGPQLVTFSPGQTTRSFTVSVKGDVAAESDETFHVNLSAATNATLASGAGVGTILNNDGAPQLSLSDASLSEGDFGNSAATFTVTRTGPYAGTLTFDWSTLDGTATAGTDYVSVVSGTGSINAGDASTTITVDVVGDVDVEIGETFVVSITNAVYEFGGTVPPVSAVGTIENDDGVPPGALVISEFRLRGPGGSNDEFVEIANTTSSPITISEIGDPSPSGGFSVAQGGVNLFTIPNGTVIPARGHYLGANTGYTLSNYGGPSAALPDAVWSVDAIDDGGLALFATANVANYQVTLALDAAGFTTDGAPYVEGVGQAPIGVGPFPSDYSFVRKYLPVAGGGLQDSGNTATDWVLVAIDGSTTLPGAVLGGPSPENLASERELVDSELIMSAPDGEYTLFPEGSGYPGSPAAIEFYRVFTNNTSTSLTSVRFKVSSLTGVGNALPGEAELRAVASATVTGTSATYLGLTLEGPPGFTYPLVTPPSGLTANGGLNSTMRLVSSLPLPPGSSVAVNFRVEYVNAGSFHYSLVPQAK